MVQPVVRAVLVFAAASCIVSLAACELVEACDPAIDPHCVVDDPDAAVGEPCDAEGATRCAGVAFAETCTGGQWQRTACGSATCDGGVCVAPFTTVRIVDQTASLSGQHPGADIDAVALERDDQTFYATRVTDWFIPNDIENLAPVPTEALGPPDVGPNTCDLTSGAEHWISLAGGEIVVTFDRPLRSGDRIVVYECAGAARDAFDVSIGDSERLEATFTPVLQGATGTVSVEIP